MLLYKVKLSKILRVFEKFIETDLESMMVHSFDVAKMAAALARQLNLDSTNAYIAGFLHDMGLIVYSRLVEWKEHYERDDKGRLLNGRRTFRLDTIINNMDSDNRHPVVSLAIARVLGLLERPQLDAILFHHGLPRDPLREDVRICSQILTVSDALSRTFRKSLDRGIAEAFKLTFKALKELDVDAQIKEAAFEVIKNPLDAVMIYDASSHANFFLGEDPDLDFEKILKFFKLMVMLVDFRSPFTRRHSITIAELASEIGRRMFSSKADADTLYAAGIIHDLGKIRTPLLVLHKPGKLDGHEMIVMRMHVSETYRLLEDLEEINEIIQTAILHHERLDGSGYPAGLTADDIPMKARILQIADVFVALTEERPYRPGLSYQEALRVIGEEVKKGKLDGNVYSALRDMIEGGYRITHRTGVLEGLFDVSDAEDLLKRVEGL